jgi:hypothetical protein
VKICFVGFSVNEIWGDGLGAFGGAGVGGVSDRVHSVGVGGGGEVSADAGVALHVQQPGVAGLLDAAAAMRPSSSSFRATWARRSSRRLTCGA